MGMQHPSEGLIITVINVLKVILKRIIYYNNTVHTLLITRRFIFM